MKFYIDFEATQFGGRIISIGCVAENGETFKTLVKPSKPKEGITKFITELTGITKEMIETAPEADDAFNDFFDWVCIQNDNRPPQYFCYGDSDGTFIENTVKYMTNTCAISFAMSIKAMLTDYAPAAAGYFGLKNVGLHRVYSLLQADTEPQHHDALEDAMMLQFVENNLKDLAKPEDVNKLPPSTHIKKNKKKCPEIFLEWPGSPKKKYQADTRADETNWTVKAINSNQQNIKYFNSMETACLWVIKYLESKKSPKNEDDLRHVEKKIIKSNNNNDNYWYGFKWIIKGDEN